MGRGFVTVFATEIILIALAATALSRANRPLLIPVVVMAIVGAHFVPLAKIFQVPTYFVMGVALICLAAGSLLIPDENLRVLTLGIASTLVLWVSAVRVLAVHAKSPSPNQTV